MLNSALQPLLKRQIQENKTHLNFNRVVTAYVDGAITHNPGGRAGISIYMVERDTHIITAGYVLGNGEHLTNNVAEFAACLQAVELAKQLNLDASDCLTIFSDSRLITETLLHDRELTCVGVYRSTAIATAQLIKHVPFYVRLEWIPRESNQIADKIAKLASNGTSTLETKLECFGGL